MGCLVLRAGVTNLGLPLPDPFRAGEAGSVLVDFCAQGPGPVELAKAVAAWFQLSPWATRVCHAVGRHAEGSAADGALGDGAEPRPLALCLVL